MGAFAALGVGLLGTAAGRTAATLAMGGTRETQYMSKLDKIAQNDLVQSATFGSSATTPSDLSQNLLQNITGSGSGASRELTDLAVGFDREGTLSRISELDEIISGYNPTQGASATDRYTAAMTERGSLTAEMSRADSRYGTANQISQTLQDREARLALKREEAQMQLERTQIANRQANFRQQIRGGNVGKITNLSSKTLLGDNL